MVSRPSPNESATKESSMFTAIFDVEQLTRNQLLYAFGERKLSSGKCSLAGD
jgi:hypothetical protein